MATYSKDKKYKNYYVGCSDYFGKNRVDGFLNDNIASVCAKYKVSAKDFEKIANAFIEACENAYSNGADNRECEMNEF